jgi:hypothetical protein
MIGELGTRLQCPCGEWVGLTLTAGPAQREGGGRLVMPITFDKDQFILDFSTHVLDDPTNENHTPFVNAVHDADD